MRDFGSTKVRKIIKENQVVGRDLICQNVQIQKDKQFGKGACREILEFRLINS